MWIDPLKSLNILVVSNVESVFGRCLVDTNAVMLQAAQAMISGQTHSTYSPRWENSGSPPVEHELKEDVKRR